MRAVAAALALWLAGQAAAAETPPGSDVSCDESYAGGEHVCLLQFMQKQLAEEAEPVLLLHVAANMSHEDTGPECPGAPVELTAAQGKCSASGVDVVVKDGSSITEFFGDNVQMKDFHFYVNGAKDAWVNLKEFHFQVGSHAVVIEGRDLAENPRKCHRTVVVRDTQKPTWATDVSTVLPSVTMVLDESCSRTASSTLNEYEQMGWDPAATDNCPGTPEITRQVKRKGVVVYDDSQADSLDMLSGPGSYELVYTATDAAGTTAQHTAVVHLQDKTAPPPNSVVGCPEDVLVKIAAGETQGVVHWTLPHLGADNCLKYGAVPPPVEANGRKPGVFGLGDHPISYSLRDSSGNVAAEECSFIVKVEDKSHPIVLTCPASVTSNTVENAEFGVPTWDPATATQGGVALAKGSLEYLHGVRPGLPFPYGRTMVTVRATGEGGATAECTFTVTIHDPQRPNADGRMYRCGGAGDALPYDVCDGTALTVSKHDSYPTTGGYDIQGSENAGSLVCCSDQHGTEYTCSGTGKGYLFKYCKPKEGQKPAPDPVLPPAPDLMSGAPEPTPEDGGGGGDYAMPCTLDMNYYSPAQLHVDGCGYPAFRPEQICLHGQTFSVTKAWNSDGGTSVNVKPRFPKKKGGFFKKGDPLTPGPCPKTEKGAPTETPCYTELAGNCNGHVISESIGVSPADCEAACEADAKCQGYTYSKKSYKKKEGKCILKSKSCATPPGKCTDPYCFFMKGGPACGGAAPAPAKDTGKGGDGKIGNPDCGNPGGGVCLSPMLLLQVDHVASQAPMRTFTAAGCGACKAECEALANCQWYAFCPKKNPQCKAMPDQCRLWSECMPPRFFASR